MSDLLDRLDAFKKRGLISEKETTLLAEFAAGGESCEKALSEALSRAGWARDVNGTRKALGKILVRANTGKCFF